MPGPSIRTVIDTAKFVLAHKRVTSQPNFWLKSGKGTRAIPLFNSEPMLLFLSAEDIQAADLNPAIDNLKTTSARERWVNQMLKKAVIEGGCKQVLILGAGFDIRAHKKGSDYKESSSPYSDVRFFEVDRREILDEKEAVFKRHSKHKNATYIRGDYTEQDIFQQLSETDFDFKAKTLIIWEGNLMYLSHEKIQSLLEQLTERLTHFSIVFDFFSQTMIDQIKQMTSGKEVAEALWQSGIDNLESFAQAHDLTVIAHRKIGELEQEYQVDSSPSEGAMNYQICALGKGL